MKRTSHLILFSAHLENLISRPIVGFEISIKESSTNDIFLSLTHTFEADLHCAHEFYLVHVSKPVQLWGLLQSFKVSSIPLIIHRREYYNVVYFLYKQLSEFVEQFSSTKSPAFAASEVILKVFTILSINTCTNITDRQSFAIPAFFEKASILRLAMSWSRTHLFILLNHGKVIAWLPQLSYCSYRWRKSESLFIFCSFNYAPSTFSMTRWTITG